MRAAIFSTILLTLISSRNLNAQTLDLSPIYWETNAVIAIGNKNYPEALKHYNFGCDLGVADACKQVGNFYGEGKPGIAKSLTKALEYHDKACGYKLYNSCTIVGNLYSNKEVGTPDYAKSKLYYEKACNPQYPDAMGCYFRGILAKSEPSEKVTIPPTNGAKVKPKTDNTKSKAKYYFDLGCSMNFAPACEESKKIY